MTANENNVTLYNTKDIKKIFRCSRTQSYNIMNMNGFPSFRINATLYVEKSALEKWLDKNVGKKSLT